MMRQRLQRETSLLLCCCVLGSRCVWVVVDEFDDEHIQPLFPHTDNYQKFDQQQEIFNAIATLSSDQRAIVILHDINGYTLPELSQIMGTPLGTLKSNLHRARASLKKQITLLPSELNAQQYQ